MKKHTVLALLLSLLLPAAAVAQTGIQAPQGWSLGLMGGAAAFTDMQRGSVRVSRATATGFEERELARRVGAETSTALAAYLAWWPSRNWGLRLHGSWSPSRFETIMHQGDAEYAGMPESSVDGSRLAGLHILSVDLQGMFRLPTIKDRVMPYGILGGGVARYTVAQGEEPVPEEAEGEFEGGSKIRPEAVFGLGAMLPVKNRSFRLHFELTNHLAGTPIQGGDSQEVPLVDGGIRFDPRDEPAGDRRVSIMNGVRFMIGLSWNP